MKKIVLYLSDDKKAYLKYTDDESLLKFKAPEEYEEYGILRQLADISERWQLNKIIKTKNKLTLDFKLLIRKT